MIHIFDSYGEVLLIITKSYLEDVGMVVAIFHIIGLYRINLGRFF